MKILLAVDVQEEFRDKDGMYERILCFIEKHREEYDAVYATVCGNSINSPFHTKGVWEGCLEGIKPLAFTPDASFLKYGYGFRDYGWLNPHNEYHIIGYNTDCCVYKIAMDLFDRDYNFKVLSGLCYSSNGAEHHERGVSILKDALGDLVE